MRSQLTKSTYKIQLTVGGCSSTPTTSAVPPALAAPRAQQAATDLQAHGGAQQLSADPRPLRRCLPQPTTLQPQPGRARPPGKRRPAGCDRPKALLRRPPPRVLGKKKWERENGRAAERIRLRETPISRLEPGHLELGSSSSRRLGRWALLGRLGGKLNASRMCFWAEL